MVGGLNSSLFESQFQEVRPPDLCEEDAVTILEILESIFTYDPEKRPSAEALIRLHWFESA